MIFITGDNMNEVLKQFLYIVATCAVVVCILGLNCRWSWWNILSYIISISSIFFFIYERWLWKKLPLGITHTPVLPKELKGKFTYRLSHMSQFQAKEAMMSIAQTLMSIRVVVKTDEMKSVSVSASIRKENGEYILYYIYRTDPKNQYIDTNPSKYGAVRIDLSQLPNLEGQYWTTHSKGDLEFSSL